MPSVLDAPHVKRIEIPYRAFSLTDGIHKDPTRLRVVDCGRRFGKSLMALMEGFCLSYDAIQKGVTRPRGIIVAPTNQMLRENWQTANQVLKQAITQSVISEQRLELGAFGQMEFRSTESQGGAGRGAGYDWAILDEASRIPQDAWESDIRPALSDKQGRALIISTPNGLNWFYDLYRQGQEGDPAIKSWRYSTLDAWRARFEQQHPDRWQAAQEEWALIQRTTSEAKFRQEYLAEFLASEGQHFTLKDALWRGQLRAAVPGRHYVAGIDVARKEDWMVTVVVEQESQQVVALTRSRHQDWSMQKAHALALLEGFPQCLTYVDSTGVGDPIAQDLRAAGLNVMDVLFTPRAKSELVENLTLAIEQCYLGVPNEQATQWLLDELRQYQAMRMPSGAIRYGAPEGKHDDGVTALMLAAWGLQGQWRHPQAAAVIQPHWWERPGMEWEWLAYEKQVRAFQHRFPMRQPPMHPTDLAWTLVGGRN